MRLIKKYTSLTLLTSSLAVYAMSPAWANVFRPGGGLGGAAAPQSPASEGWWGAIVSFIYGVQANFYQSMNQSLSAMKADGTAGLYLMLFALLYGFFHAAGPGHGKVVVSSYVLADRLTLKKGIGLAFLSAAIQGLMAIGLIGIAAILFNATRNELIGQAAFLEKASFALIAALGLYVIFRALKPYLMPRLALAGAGAVHAHDHDHSHGHHHHHHAHTHGHGHSHDHHHHDDACGCGHAHMPKAAEVAGLTSASQFIAAAFAIGVRPCTGALVVLVFALSQGLFLAGMAAVGVMSLGTAIMVSLIAIVAVGARDIALRLYGKSRDQSGTGLALSLQVVGGIILFLFGLAMFLGPVQGT